VSCKPRLPPSPPRTSQSPEFPREKTKCDAAWALKRPSVGYLYIAQAAPEAGNPYQAQKWLEKAKGIDQALAAKPNVPPIPPAMWLKTSRSWPWWRSIRIYPSKAARTVGMQILMAWAWSRRNSGECADIAGLIEMIGAESNSRVDLQPLEWRSRTAPVARTLLQRTHSGSFERVRRGPTAARVGKSPVINVRSAT
jgi:hypothetical protein